MADNSRRLPRRVYPLRVLGMGLGTLVASVVLWERQAGVAAWGFIIFAGLVWPHLAYLWSSRAPDPYRAEIRNLLIDSAMAGAYVPLMHFNLLPSVLLITLTLVDKITPGIRGLALRSIPGMVGAGLLCTWLTGAQVSLESSMAVILVCLPMLVLHTLAVSITAYRLIRTVSEQNRQLEELRRIDPLTGLYGRNHWEQQAAAALSRCAQRGEPACLLMLDIDGFKQINDTLGHTVGDDVIRALSHIVRGCVRASDCAGRYGGDEFGVVLADTDAPRALEVAQRIREQAENYRFRDHPTLRFTCSIGVAKARPTRHAALRNWVVAADAALYAAKRKGRNRVEADPVTATTVPAALLTS